jgi:hypothetical protein
MNLLYVTMKTATAALKRAGGTSIKIPIGRFTVSEKNDPQEVGENTVVTLDYTLTVDGEVVDTSKGSMPIQFIQGQQQIIPGLEKELVRAFSRRDERS